MRKMLLVALVVGACAAAGYFAVGRRGVDPTSTASDRGRYAFEDATEARGIRFVHDTGKPVFYFPEIMGAGVALLDYDNDGRLDILFRGTVAGPPHPHGREGRSCTLYHQEPDGSFVDATAKSGLDHVGYAMGVAVGDVDNDGYPDIYLTNFGGDRLYRNRRDGTFEDVTKESGLDNAGWATSATFFDFDRDGRLDLYVCNYGDYARPVPCVSSNGRRDYCHPLAYVGTQHRLFHNVSTPGRIRFEDATARAGVAGYRGRGLGVLASDFNDDGWPDLYVCNDAEPNFVWINNRNGTFTESGASLGGAVDAAGKPLGSMGIAEADLDGDGRPDLFIAAFRNEHTMLQRNHPFGFVDESASVGLNALTRRSTGFGLAMIDVDQDGTPELLQANGSATQKETAEAMLPEPDLGKFWSGYRETTQLLAFRDGRFHDVGPQAGALGRYSAVARGLAVGDVDGDGALDVVVLSLADRGRLFLNRAADRGHWLQLRVVDPNNGGRDAYGAKVTLRAGGRKVVRTVQTGSSYQSANAPMLHFGLGDSSTYDGVDVRWPDGPLAGERFPGGAADGVVRIERGKGTR